MVAYVKMSFIASLAAISDWSKVCSMESVSGASRESSVGGHPKSAQNPPINRRSSLDSRLAEIRIPTHRYNESTSRSSASIPNSVLLPHDALDVMEETYSSSFFETEPLYQFYDMPSIHETPEDDSEFGEGKIEDCLTQENANETDETDSGEGKKKRALSRSGSKKMQVLTNIFSQNTTWHEMPIVRESGILG